MRFATLPEGQDPDDLLRHGGLRGLQTVLSQAEGLSASLWRWERMVMAGNGAEQRAALWSRISAQLKTVADPSLSAAIEAEMVQRFEASFGHHPYRTSAGRQWERARQYQGQYRAGIRASSMDRAAAP